MRVARFLFVVPLLVVLISCSSGGDGPATPSCSAGQACTPSGVADPCKGYATVCDATGTISTCSATSNQADGHACGSGNVCSAGTCVTACVAGTACTPAGSASTCQLYATTCDATLVHTTCSVASTRPDGLACPTGVCQGGACVSTCGQACSPSGTPNPCASYSTICDAGGAPVGCAASSTLADGATCGAGNVCLSGACIPACVPGVACTPSGAPNSCKVYTATCNATSTQTTCGATGNKPSGTSCGIGGSCTTGTCFGGVAPAMSPAAGTYTAGQVVTITHPAASATVYYTTDGTEPDNSASVTSPSFTGGSHSLTLLASTTVKAFAFVDGMRSTTTSASYTINPPTPTPPPPSFGSGFTSGSVQLNGNAIIAATRLQLTGDVFSEVASAFYVIPVNVLSFTSDFTFQMTNAGTGPLADGMTFTLQGVGPFAIGSMGGGLGYGPEPQVGSFVSRVLKSVAVKFDTFNDVGEGDNSTGVYTGGEAPALPAVPFPPGTIDLHSGHVFAVHLDYSGVTLTVTVTDTSVPAPRPTFTQSYTVDIPAAVGGSTAYVGFTAATGGAAAKQDVLTWTFTPRP
jgi:hypothetical protein